MRVLVITDELFASREHPLLERLEVGLADEGVRVIHAVPESSVPAEATGLYSRAITYSAKTLALTRPLAVRRVARALEEIVQAEGGGGIDLVHAFGGSVWSLAGDLAGVLGAGLVLEVWRAGLVQRAAGMGRGLEGGPLLLAPDVTIERALIAASDSEVAVRAAPWGVHAPSAPREPLPEGREWTAMIASSGMDVAGMRAAATGLAQAAAGREMLVFADAEAARRTRLWAHARTLGMLPRLSLIEELEGRRDLLLQGDVLIVPEAKGEQRSVVLEAMAGGMIVVAARDDMVSVLQDGRTARLVPGADAGVWGEVLRDVLEHREKTAALARSAAEYVRIQRRASEHVRAVLEAYRWMSGRDAIPFRGVKGGA